MVKVNQKKKTYFLTTASQYQVYHKTITLLLFNHIFPECVKYSNDFFFEWNRRRLQAAITGFAAASLQFHGGFVLQRWRVLAPKQPFQSPKPIFSSSKLLSFTPLLFLNAKDAIFVMLLVSLPTSFSSYVHMYMEWILWFFFLNLGFFLIYIFCVVFSAFDELGYSFWSCWLAF